MKKIQEIIEKQLEGNPSEQATWAREALHKNDIDRAMTFASNEIAEKPENDLLRSIKIIEVYRGWIKSLLIGAVVLSCNQQMYDAIYGAILQMTLDAPKLTSKVIDYKNDTIENLRKLCNGQKSSYEKH